MFADDISRPSLSLITPQVNVVRAVPKLPGSLRDDYDGSIAEVRSLVIEALGDDELGQRFANPVQWFYTPMPAPAMLGALHEVGVVYDCMDELAQFRFAHPDLLRRERLLLGNADVVFTGGHKLFQAKSRFNTNVHFFGCGVDFDHYVSARSSETEIPADVADVPAPVAGYFGVIDERLDYDLIRHVAASGVSVVMVGPVVKVDPASLPQAPNIHWMGQRSYDELPSYVKTFDVCLMPFAINEATEYINPTKTLEYMAAGKPIVSTAVADVVHNFTPIVRVADTAAEFVDEVRQALLVPDLRSIADGMACASAASWESITMRMQALIAEAVAAPRLWLRPSPENAAQPTASDRAGMTAALRPVASGTSA